MTLENPIILLNQAGLVANDPILAGIGITIAARFKDKIHGITGKIGQTNPPTTNITLTQNQADSYLYEYSGVAGAAPLAIGKNYLRIQATSTLTGDITTLDYQFYIAAEPSDLIEVWSITQSNWVVPSSSVTVSQMMAVRFLNSWYDAYRIKHFGGVGYIDVYNSGTRQIRPISNGRIDNIYYFYLQKHAIATIETHNFTVKYKANANDAGIIKNYTVRSPACIALEIQDPQTS
jgi:hypothetical protein